MERFHSRVFPFTRSLATQGMYRWFYLMEWDWGRHIKWETLKVFYMRMKYCIYGCINESGHFVRFIGFFFLLIWRLISWKKNIYLFYHFVHNFKRYFVDQHIHMNLNCSTSRMVSTKKATKKISLFYYSCWLFWGICDHFWISIQPQWRWFRLNKSDAVPKPIKF